MGDIIFNCSNTRNNLVQVLSLSKNLETYKSLFGLETSCSESLINGQIYYHDSILEDINIIIRLIRRGWSYIQSAALFSTTNSNQEIIQTRIEINTCLRLIIHSLKCCDNNDMKARYISSIWKEISLFTPLVIPFSEVDDYIFSKLSSVAPNEQCPVHQYFHTYIEIQYYLLLLYRDSGKHHEFEAHLTRVISDLIFANHQCYTHRNESSFSCDCTKHFWLFIQMITENFLANDAFWPKFNTLAEKHPDKEFVLRLLHDVALLQALSYAGADTGCLSARIQPNFALLESSLKQVLSNRDSYSLLPTLQAIQPLVCSLWSKSGKIEIYQMIWEHFSKRLNVGDTENTHVSMSELVERIDTVLWAPQDCQDEFELFVALLSAHLSIHPHHWGKMKGRIYSQLGPNKVKLLSDRGRFNISLLFVCLGKVRAEELAKMFRNFVEALPETKRQSPLVWNFYGALIVRHVREDLDIEAVSSVWIKMLEKASHDSNQHHLIKTFISDFEIIVKFSGNLQLHQWLLLNQWIHKYMSTCYYPDLVVLLKVLITIIERINTHRVWCDWEASFKTHVYPALKKVSTSATAPIESGVLAAKIALLSPALLAEDFAFFNGEGIIPEVSSSFLCTLLSDYPNSFVMTAQQETIALQTWVKVCLFTRDNYEVITRNIVKLDILPTFIKKEVVTANDPLMCFIETISLNVKEHMKSVNMNKLCETCFDVAESWIKQYFAQPDNEATVYRVCTCVALAFIKIGELLYDRHKSQSTFTRLVSSFILPTEIMIGKPINPMILTAMKKTWRLFFTATIKLNNPPDPFLDRTLRELVVRYIPHFAIVDSPMLTCLDTEQIAEVVLKKMSIAFFTHPAKEAESNIFKALKIISDFVKGTTSMNALRRVVLIALFGVFEVVMFHNQRNTALGIIQSITSSVLYPQVRSDFEDIIFNVTKKHIAFNTSNYFQLMGILVKFVPSSLEFLMPRIKQEISSVERMRGVGLDNTLRVYLDKLEAGLLQARNT